MSSGGSLISHKERLWRAVKWLDEQKCRDHTVVEEACLRFDLSPSDEEFLQSLWRRSSGKSTAPGPG